MKFAHRDLTAALCGTNCTYLLQTRTLAFWRNVQQEHPLSRLKCAQTKPQSQPATLFGQTPFDGHVGAPRPSLHVPGGPALGASSLPCEVLTAWTLGTSGHKEALTLGSLLLAALLGAVALQMGKKDKALESMEQGSSWC